MENIWNNLILRKYAWAAEMKKPVEGDDIMMIWE